MDFEQQLMDLRRRAETSHAEQESAIQREKAEAERYIHEQRASFDEEQWQREAKWNAERLQAEAIFAEEKRRSAAEAEARARPISRKECVLKSRRDCGENRIMPMLWPKMPALKSLPISFEIPN